MTLERLVLVRHGETDYNAEGRMQGHLDSELTERGLEQAERTAAELVGYGAVRLISSDLSRAARTAERIGVACGLPVKLDARLRETHIGRWQGRTTVEVEDRWPGGLGRWRSDPTWAPPGGESRVAVAARGRPVVDELVAEFAEDPSVTVILCAHGGLITALSCEVLGLEVGSWMSFGGLGNARWVVLEHSDDRGGRWRMIGFNLGDPG